MTDTREEAAPSLDIAETSSPASGPPSFGIQGWLAWAWRTLTSMRTALILLFLLVLGAIPGSMLPQEGTDPASVSNYFTAHPAIAPLLNRLGLFNVYASPWFAAIYILLFASLIGCVVPRTFKLVGSARTLPPRAPRNVAKLPHSAVYETTLSPEAAIDASAAMLERRGFRLRRDTDWISAEKGYLREAGNLLFHLALLGVLVSVAVGGLFGYKADKVLIAGDSFADTGSNLDEFHPGRLVSDSDLAPFTLTLKSFKATYYSSGSDSGDPESYDAYVSYTANPGTAAKSYDLKVNAPLRVDGTKVYLIGHGFAPVFKVTDAAGKVVYNQATVFIPNSTADYISDGVVKAPDAAPQQLGFAGVFAPTGAESASGTLESIWPSALDPVVSLIAYEGNLGEDSGPAQSVYQLDTSQMQRIGTTAKVLTVGQSWTLKGYGTITFEGYQQWISLQVTYDPGQVAALVCGMLALCGLVLSFLIRRRRIFVRASPAGSGASVAFGGLARTDASGGFAEEFVELANDMLAEHRAAEPAEPEQPSPQNTQGE
jgi:cytochrome c biogenesis protein